MNELQLNSGPYRATFMGLVVSRKSTKKEWINYLGIIKRIGGAEQWIIGDALVDGMHHFEKEHGEKKKHAGTGLYEEAEKILEIPMVTLKNLKSISGIFELSRRRDNLSWGHHAEVASLKTVVTVEDKKLPQGRMQWSDIPDDEKMAEFLGKTEIKEWSILELREEVKTYKRNKEAEFALHNSPKKFDVLYADPPWEYDFSETESRKIENQYPTMSLEEICSLKVPYADDSVLFLWATAPKLKEAIQVMESWGFRYVTQAVWDKEKIGMGYWFRGQHELLLVGVRGKFGPPPEELRSSSVIREEREGHSEKPIKAYEIIETMFPGLRKIELFSRSKRQGWTHWGNEAA